MRVDGGALEVEGTVGAEAGSAELVASRRGEGDEVVVPAQLERGRFAARLDLAELALPGGQPDVWNLRLVADRRAYRLGTHLDGIPNRGEATEFPAVQVGGRRLRPYYTVENNVSVRSEVGGPDAPARPPADEEAKPGLARRVLGRPAILVHRLALRLAALRPGGGKPDGCDVRIVVLHAWGMGGTVRAALSLAQSLAESGRSVEIVSVVRRSGEPFFPFPDGVKVTAVDDQRGKPSPPARLPSLLVHPEDFAYPWASLRTDLKLLRRFRAMQGGVVIGTRPGFNLLAVRARARGHRHRRAGAHELPRPPPRARARRPPPLPLARRARGADRGGPPRLRGRTRRRHPRRAPAQRGAAAGRRASRPRRQGRRRGRAAQLPEGLRPPDRGVEAGRRGAPGLAAADLRPRAAPRGATSARRATPASPARCCCRAPRATSAPRSPRARCSRSRRASRASGSSSSRR